MIRKISTVVAVTLVVAGTWYANSLVMTEHEHDLDLPVSSRLVRSDVKWWLPRGEEHDSYKKSLVEMSQHDFTAWVASLQNCVACEPIQCTVGSRFDLFPVAYGDVTHLEVISVDVTGRALIEIITVYT